jgi:threonine dehydrogenase-like Zn-dependent dehydrogenase
MVAMQAENSVVCYVKGHVVLECNNIGDNLDYEEAMFSDMFNTALHLFNQMSES